MAGQTERASLRAVASGSVQGVFYRMFVVREASGLGLCGSVRNLLDGRVEVTAEGERQKLEQLVQRLRKGPPKAQVSDVTAEWDEYGHEHDSFQIEYD
jgi:acylphosphatase